MNFIYNIFKCLVFGVSMLAGLAILVVGCAVVVDKIITAAGLSLGLIDKADGVFTLFVLGAVGLISICGFIGYVVFEEVKRYGRKGKDG